jgi:hypothetical protein
MTMKTRLISSLSAVVMCGIIVANLQAQEQTSTDWQFMPGFIYVKHFPGNNFQIPAYDSPVQWNYEGSALLFRARAFNSAFQHLAFTISGGFEWYSQPDHESAVMPAMRTEGIGQTSRGRNFTAFPIGIGAQYFTPESKEKDIMFFAGGEAVLHLVDASVGIGQQTKLGYNLLGGFSIRFFEFGIQYSAFSDMRNLGAYLGLRFNQFGAK